MRRAAKNVRLNKAKKGVKKMVAHNAGKKGGAKKGGRVTSKGPAPVNKAAFALPSLEEMQSQLPPGAKLPGLDP